MIGTAILRAPPDRFIRRQTEALIKGDHLGLAGSGPPTRSRSTPSLAVGVGGIGPGFAVVLRIDAFGFPVRKARSYGPRLRVATAGQERYPVNGHPSDKNGIPFGMRHFRSCSAVFLLRFPSWNGAGRVVNIGERADCTAGAPLSLGRVPQDTTGREPAVKMQGLGIRPSASVIAGLIITGPLPKSSGSGLCMSRAYILIGSNLDNRIATKINWKNSAWLAPTSSALGIISWKVSVFGPEKHLRVRSGGQAAGRRVLQRGDLLWALKSTCPGPDDGACDRRPGRRRGGGLGGAGKRGRRSSGGPSNTPAVRTRDGREATGPIGPGPHCFSR